MPKIVHCGLDYSGGGGGSGEANFIELSQGEYNALSYEEKHDPNKMYLITDGPEAEAQYFDPIIYSTYEREVGVWIDGKPLYQITVTGKFSGTSFAYDTGITDMEVKHYYISHTRPDASCSEYKSIIDDPDYFKIKQIQEGAISLTKSSSAAYGSSNTVFVTIQYTKSSDTPGSGNYASNGVPAVYYDSQERVIGTWFGKPLYEKVIDNLSATMSWNGTYRSEAIINYNASDIKCIVKAIGIKEDASEPQTFCLSVSITNNKSELNVYGISGDTINKLIIQYTKTTD